VETLVMFDQFCDFNRLVEDGAPSEAEIMGSCPILWDFWVQGLYNGYGMSTHGFTHVTNKVIQEFFEQEALVK
jgi:hypothetical protein